VYGQLIGFTSLPAHKHLPDSNKEHDSLYTKPRADLYLHFSGLTNELTVHAGRWSGHLAYLTSNIALCL
jgi:hypothetical protein